MLGQMGGGGAQTHARVRESWEQIVGTGALGRFWVISVATSLTSLDAQSSAVIISGIHKSFSLGLTQVLHLLRGHPVSSTPTSSHKAAPPKCDSAKILIFMGG